VWGRTYVKRRCGWMMTLSLLARTKQLEPVSGGIDVSIVDLETYYARGNDKPNSFITSAIHIVAERDTPTRQCTSVAVPSSLPFSVFERRQLASLTITALLRPTNL